MCIATEGFTTRLFLMGSSRYLVLLGFLNRFLELAEVSETNGVEISMVQRWGASTRYTHRMASTYSARC